MQVILAPLFLSIFAGRIEQSGREGRTRQPEMHQGTFVLHAPVILEPMVGAINTPVVAATEQAVVPVLLERAVGEAQ
jgi:hypothetical protein